MSTGGVFKLIANDGRADKLIMATDLLNSRIRNIMCTRARRGMADPTPSLMDLEKTHVIFMNAHFRPFAAIGYEYNKTKVNGGNASFGGSVTFSIPQAGDFFADMAVSVPLRSVSCTAGTVPSFPGYIGTDNLVTTATASSSGIENAVTGVYTKYTYEYVNAQGTVLAPGSAISNYVRYCDYPGERLFRQVKFEVNNNPLDSYGASSTLFKDKFRIATDKRTGWDRLMGQEIPRTAVSDLHTIQGQSQAPEFASNLVINSGVNAGEDAPASQISSSVTSRMLAQFVDGPQTPKATQPDLNLLVPLDLWFNTDFQVSVPSVAIPYGQRFITIDMEEQNRIVFPSAGSLFLRLTVQTQQTGVMVASSGTADAIGVNIVNTVMTQTPVLVPNSVVDTSQQVGNMELYINNIYMNSEVHDIYLRRIGFSLIRVHRESSYQVREANNNILLSNLKWPVEFLEVGGRPVINTLSANTNQARDWHHLTEVRDEVVQTYSKAYSEFVSDAALAFSLPSSGVGASAAKNVQSSTVGGVVYNLPVHTETIDTLGIQAHSIALYNPYPVRFYRDYLPYVFGEGKLVTPKDPGAFFVNFCLYPFTYQPSGHVNVSRAREFYLSYESSYITSLTPVEVLVVASAINFLLISDGSAVLRYST